MQTAVQLAGVTDRLRLGSPASPLDRQETMSVQPANARLLGLEDVDEAAQVLSEALSEDPLCVFMLPSRRSRTKVLFKFFRIYCELNINNKRGYGVGKPLDGVAFWKSPEQGDLSIRVSQIPKLAPLLFSKYSIGFVRARAITKRIDELHREFAPEPHFYLDNIGVLENVRGKGIASELIRPILEEADVQKVASYTDTVTRDNVPLYQHLGFDCLEKSLVPGTGITVWALRREPHLANLPVHHLGELS